MATEISTRLRDDVLELVTCSSSQAYSIQSAHFSGTLHKIFTIARRFFGFLMLIYLGLVA